MSAPTPNPLLRPLVQLVAGLGIAADAALFVIEAPGPLGIRIYAFALWLVLPWIAALVIVRRPPATGLFPGTALAAGFELIAFYAAFIWPRGSTPALIFAVKPVWQIGLMGVSMRAGAAIARWRYDRNH
jgi:hypothetical protein